MSNDNDDLQMKVDVGVLKEQVNKITELCGKMDKVIEKIIEDQDKDILNIYKSMEDRRTETQSNIKEIHDRIDTVLDKVQASELRLLDEIKELRRDMSIHSRQEKIEFEELVRELSNKNKSNDNQNDHKETHKESIDKIMQWKWMVIGGIIVLAWVFSHLEIFSIFAHK